MRKATSVIARTASRYSTLSASRSLAPYRGALALARLARLIGRVPPRRLDRTRAAPSRQHVRRDSRAQEVSMRSLSSWPQASAVAIGKASVRLGLKNQTLKAMATSGQRTLNTLRVGGVPEHFNTPWHTAEAKGSFAAAGIKLEWHECKGGTGEMALALRNDKIDVAILLTEGIVTDIHKGSSARLLGTYVASPLCWGVHAKGTSSFASVDDYYHRPAGEGKIRYAVSRMGSGSHLMAVVDARSRFGDAAVKRLHFEVVGTLDGARAALREGTADLFMWEKFTTKPYVDSGEFKRVGECLTPWPCFMMAVTDKAVATSTPELKAMAEIVSEEAAELTMNPASVQTIAKMYNLLEEDVQSWMARTRWSGKPAVSFNMLSQVMSSLADVGVLERTALLQPKDLVSPITINDMDD